MKTVAAAVAATGTVFDLAAAPQSNYVADLMGTNLLHGRLTGSSFVVRGGGELKDEQRSVMTGQTVEHYRQRISDFCRRRMSKRA